MLADFARRLGLKRALRASSCQEACSMDRDASGFWWTFGTSGQICGVCGLVLGRFLVQRTGLRTDSRRDIGQASTYETADPLEKRCLSKNSTLQIRSVLQKSDYW